METEKSQRVVADYSLFNNTMALLNSKTLATVHLLSENSGCYLGNQTDVSLQRFAEQCSFGWLRVSGCNSSKKKKKSGGKEGVQFYKMPEG